MHMKTWPHSPTHILEATGAYMVTAATLQKLPIFRSSENLTYLSDLLLELAEKYQWKLQAWAVFPNHYHFVAMAPPDAKTLKKLIQDLHSVSATEINRRQNQPGRQAWYQYWDTQLTNDKSFLARVSYVHRNAVRHGLVREASLYPWCSAGWFSLRAERSLYRRVMEMKIDKVSVRDEYDVRPEDCDSSGVRELAPALPREACFAELNIRAAGAPRALRNTQPSNPGAPRFVSPQQAATEQSGSKLPHSTANLTRAQAENAMEEILSGAAGNEAITAFLRALREKGVTVDELVGFATVMRRHAAKIFPNGAPAEWTLVDTCGTGGDAAGTFNISTCAAFVVAGAGVRVAKHGNRSISSRCGSADVLEALGVKIDHTPAEVRACIQRVGIGFMFAPLMHSAVKHAMPARRALGGRTVFNLLGPLTNPAGAQVQVLGVYDASLTELMAQALAELGSKRAFVVHGADGLDEISLSGETRISEVRDGRVRTFTVLPEDVGLPRAPLSSIAGGDAQHNAQIIRDVLSGRPGPYRDIVLANAAAALVAAGQAPDFRIGVRLAGESIHCGAAADKVAGLAG
jgi:anthranilate phosphoribosyltransferase